MCPCRSIRRSVKSNLASALCCLEGLHHHAYGQKWLCWIGRSNVFGLGRSPRVCHELLHRWLRWPHCLRLALTRNDEDSICAARHILHIAAKRAVGNTLPLPRCFRAPMICADLEGCQDDRHGACISFKTQKAKRRWHDSHKGYCAAD